MDLGGVLVEPCRHHMLGFFNRHAIDMVDFSPISGSLTNSGDLYLGRGTPALGISDGLRGILDEVTVYNQPLKPQEVESLSCAHCAGKSRPPFKSIPGPKFTPKF